MKAAARVSNEPLVNFFASLQRKRPETRREAHERAENALRRFFSEDAVESAMPKLAEAILERRFLSGKDATELVNKTNILENPALLELLSAEH